MQRKIKLQAFTWLYRHAQDRTVNAPQKYPNLSSFSYKLWSSSGINIRTTAVPSILGMKLSEISANDITIFNWRKNLDDLTQQIERMWGSEI